jgi:Fe-S-cluster-containing hydrogenase component 2
MKQSPARIRRSIVSIDQKKCDGCGACVISCAEGALEIVDGKVRIVADKYCDSLGACLPGCPQGAISIVERMAEPFDEEAVKAKLAKKDTAAEPVACVCPSSAVAQFKTISSDLRSSSRPASQSQLCHWPVQLALVPPGASFLKGADVLLAADCTAFACGGFHQNLLRGHALLIACPKLDDYERRLERLTQILCQSDIKSLTVLRMEVPCCSGLTHMARQAILACNKEIPFQEKILGVGGDLKS